MQRDRDAEVGADVIDRYEIDSDAVLNSEREVIIFDNRGTGQSSGTPAAAMEGLAEGVLEFVDALGLTTVDLLGWSLGDFVAEIATLLRPNARGHRGPARGRDLLVWPVGPPN
jgi:pimeloyl-ACP methyl ester carboxylesterase